MSIWPRYPTIYEINTWVWLAELSAKAGRSVDLGSVPSAEWDAIVACGFDAVWLMGVRKSASRLWFRLAIEIEPVLGAPGRDLQGFCASSKIIPLHR